MISDYTERYLGYLPAEHIETPLERLARLNKHRNLDVRLSLKIEGRNFIDVISQF